MKEFLRIASIIMSILLYLFCAFLIILIFYKEISIGSLTFIAIILGVMFVLSMILYFMSDQPMSVNISFFQLFGVAFDYKGKGQKVDRVCEKGVKGETKETIYRN